MYWTNLSFWTTFFFFFLNVIVILKIMNCVIFNGLTPSMIIAAGYCVSVVFFSFFHPRWAWQRWGWPTFTQQWHTCIQSTDRSLHISLHQSSRQVFFPPLSVPVVVFQPSAALPAAPATQPPSSQPLFFQRLELQCFSVRHLYSP